MRGWLLHPIIFRALRKPRVQLASTCITCSAVKLDVKRWLCSSRAPSNDTVTGTVPPPPLLTLLLLRLRPKGSQRPGCSQRAGRWAGAEALR